MRARRERGSILLLCLAVVSALLLIAFAYVRVSALGHDANTNLNRELLAREAARMGLNHATEQIMRDFVAGPLNRMDDSSHAAFVAFSHPYETDYDSDLGAPNDINLNDLPAENALWPSGWHTMACAHYAWDGRGRFYEPGFYNLATAGFDPAATVATTPVKFGDNPWPAASPLPDRNQGLFYDAQMRRIATGDPRTDRANARYRLRYALGAVDLDAAVLVTGDPGVDYRQITAADPADIALTPEASRVVRAMHQLPQLLYPIFRYGNQTYNWNAGIYGKHRVEHVFIGRGGTANFDLDPATRAPVTFPLMYRGGAIGTYQGATDLYLSPSSAAGGTPIPNDQTLRRINLGPQFSFLNYDEAIEGSGTSDAEGRAYARGWATPFGRGVVAGTPGRWSGPVSTPWCVNVMTAPAAVVAGMVAGYMPPGAICRYLQEKPPTLTPAMSAGDWIGASYTATITGSRDLFVDKLSPAFANFAAPARATPAISPDYRVDDTRAWHARYPGRLAYNGNPDNLAIGGVPRRNDNLGTYLRVRTRSTGGTTYGGQVDRTGRPEVVRSFWRYKDQYVPTPMHAQPRNWSQFWVRHGEMGYNSVNGGNQPDTPPPSWVNWVSYTAGQRVTYGAGIYQASANSTNQQPDISPGAWTAVKPLGNWATAPPEYGVVGAHPDSIWEAAGSAMGAAISVARGMYLQYQNQTFSPPNTYFDNHDWQGPVPWAAIGHDTTAWSAAWGSIPRVLTLRDLDALFVANLGSNWNVPNSTAPTVCWRALTNNSRKLESFTPTWNLAGLRTATTTVQVIATTSPLLPTITNAGPPLQVDLGAPQAPIASYTFPIMAWNDPNEPRKDDAAYKDGDGILNTYSATQRTAICELIINDMRLSLMGSSPAYRDDRGDGVTCFRALDLNGDGLAHCSGFNSSGNAAEIALNLDHYAATGADVDGDGRSDVDPNGVATRRIDNYFSNTGVFFIGRSRFWRVVVRGEVWDNVLGSTVNKAQLETVLVVDPANEAREWVDGATPDPAKGQYSTHIIHQKWRFDPYRGFLTRIEP